MAGLPPSVEQSPDPIPRKWVRKTVRMLIAPDQPDAGAHSPSPAGSGSAGSGSAGNHPHVGLPYYQAGPDHWQLHRLLLPRPGRCTSTNRLSLGVQHQMKREKDAAVITLSAAWSRCPLEMQPSTAALLTAVATTRSQKSSKMLKTVKPKNLTTCATATCNTNRWKIQ